MSEIETNRPVTFDKILPQNGGIVVPETVVEGISRINNLPPDDWAFVSRGSVVRDMSTGELVIDTVDRIPEEPASLTELELRPAVMRVIRVIGDVAIDGYLVDYRRIKVFDRSNRGLEHGVDSPEHQEIRTNLGAALPLGVIFAVYEETHYYGDENFADQALRLANSVDDQVKSMTEVQQPTKNKGPLRRAIDKLRVSSAISS